MSTDPEKADSTVIGDSFNSNDTNDTSASAHDVKLTPFTIFRYIASLGLLIFSIIIVVALIFTGNTRVAAETNPWVALIVCVSILSYSIERKLQCIALALSYVYMKLNISLSSTSSLLLLHTNTKDPRGCLAFND